MFADFLKNSSIIHARLEEAGKEAVEYWKSIAPVNTDPGEPHILKSGWVDNPGDYRDSIRYEIVRNPTRMKVRVMATDYKAHWLEFGTVKMEARHPMADTREEMLNRGYQRAPNRRAL
ncbi:HK97 gp10 family phage protein [Nocardia terpenica]|uniref:HK97 gp10 family phage protein n=1 Tax=Nocardia terpenica TaxID=455432 RepID=UPI0018938603|nr:HK97 gp10 family phage protein [Nocardia terpenica]MBF6060511.1 HK97 gp10 family phage protein [Nocardia terpenica]MBF6103771.1 HK97 gp10 family phage protein [Nocardia terpenica]MBF6111855.1 HK97 gp10 family phage protein [Nocardia terpenica]MBF6117992.1 HK97 gp10 family phage protein [Nocardia terpenica]MBF6155282.1 HK97 gp10 family phage protein [Nocardia terpenica]